MSDTSYVGSETLPPDQYLGPRRFRIVCVCHECGEEYSWITTKPGGKDRPCPVKACKEAVLEREVERRAENLAKMLLEQRAPGHIGDNAQVRAIDKTAEIVMQDHGMTDLKDNIRTGEAMAPKLPPAMQAASDNFFTANPLKDRGVGSRQAELIKRRALAGAYRGMAVSPQVVGGTPGESPMRLIRTEKAAR
jgi:hypothetical protein